MQCEIFWGHASVDAYMCLVNIFCLFLGNSASWNLKYWSIVSNSNAEKLFDIMKCYPLRSLSTHDLHLGYTYLDVIANSLKKASETTFMRVERVWSAKYFFTIKKRCLYINFLSYRSELSCKAERVTWQFCSLYLSLF